MERSGLRVRPAMPDGARLPPTSRGARRMSRRPAGRLPLHGRSRLPTGGSDPASHSARY